jgi:hypothetical protein
MIKDSILKIIQTTAFGRLIAGFYFLQKNHLTKSGWKKSVVKRLPLDKNGEELPWFNYGFIYFLTPKLTKEHSIFEYGSGNSSIWFSKKVKKIVSVEHNEQWFSRMKSVFTKHPNISYLYKDLESGSYQKEIVNYDKVFDIIVIDGRERVACALNCLGALKDDGVIIFDNSDRIKYLKAYDFLISAGFKRIDFYGMGPISAHASCTSVFYKDANCLSI